MGREAASSTGLNNTTELKSDAHTVRYRDQRWQRETSEMHDGKAKNDAPKYFELYIYNCMF